MNLKTVLLMSWLFPTMKAKTGPAFWPNPLGAALLCWTRQTFCWPKTYQGLHRMNACSSTKVKYAVILTPNDKNTFFTTLQIGPLRIGHHVRILNEKQRIN